MYSQQTKNMCGEKKTCGTIQKGLICDNRVGEGEKKYGMEKLLGEMAKKSPKFGKRQTYRFKKLGEQQTGYIQKKPMTRHIIIKL